MVMQLINVCTFGAFQVFYILHLIVKNCKKQSFVIIYNQGMNYSNAREVGPVSTFLII